jgi:transcriptional repressor NrdR
MRCPSCGSIDDRVVDSREVEEGAAIRRRRECTRCGARFTTFERAVPGGLMVLKRSGAREPFERSKLVAGLQAACKNRPVDPARVEALVDGLEDEARQRGSEVSSQELGLAVLDRLRELDEVAYLRFASVYKSFEDAEDFEREAGLLLKQTAPKRPAGA